MLRRSSWTCPFNCLILLVKMCARTEITTLGNCGWGNSILSLQLPCRSFIVIELGLSLSLVVSAASNFSSSVHRALWNQRVAADWKRRILHFAFFTRQQGIEQGAVHLAWWFGRWDFIRWPLSERTEGFTPVVPLLLMFTPFLQHLRGESRVSAALANGRARKQSHTPETSHESFAQVPNYFAHHGSWTNSKIDIFF